MEDQYGLADLRQYAAGGRPFFPGISPPPQFPSTLHRSLAPSNDNHPYYVLNFLSDANSAGVAAVPPPGGGVTIAASAGVFDTEGGGRWPRQETLTLLEIRSRLDAQFKEANQKGPLWDEVSRIMCEEYGYQRSGKKCREKFENLYKYYKKTKGGKAGRQDGKHYRFFRQLEALYGTTTDQTLTSHNNNNNNGNDSLDQTNFDHFQYPKNENSSPYHYTNTINNQESHTSLITISNSSDFDAIISSDDESELNLETIDLKQKKKVGQRSLKSKIKDSIDSQMRKMMEKQEAWMERMMRTIDENEKERIMREDQWRKQDALRIEREQRLWASEKAWIEARDAALMDAFRKLSGRESRAEARGEEMIVQNQCGNHRGDWDEHMATKMNCLVGDDGHKDWDSVGDYLIKKRKESSRAINTYHHRAHEMTNERGIDNNGYSTSNNTINDGYFRYFAGDGYVWKNISMS